MRSIAGKVTSIGFYRDSLPKLVIVMPSENISEWQPGKRIPIKLEHAGACYNAGVRVDAKGTKATISPDLTDCNDQPVRLCDLLLAHNITRRMTVRLKLSGDRLSFDMGHQ
jgi:hypothetical protein